MQPQGIGNRSRCFSYIHQTLTTGGATHEQKKNKTTAELQAAAEQVDQEIAKLVAEKKGLRKQISETARKERNARLYFRGGDLTYHLLDKVELLTDEDIKLFLNYVFSFSRTQKLVSDMLAIRRGEADGTVEELLRNAMSGFSRAPFQGNDGQTS